jgi:hypothetical protein
MPLHSDLSVLLNQRLNARCRQRDALQAENGIARLIRGVSNDGGTFFLAAALHRT